MSERRFFLDRGVGETRAVVTLDGRPERLLIARDDDFAIQALGAGQSRASAPPIAIWASPSSTWAKGRMRSSI